MTKVFVQDDLYRHLLFPAYREFHGRVDEETLKGCRAFLVEGDEAVRLKTEALNLMKRGQ